MNFNVCNIQPPCKNCQQRHFNCHSSCEGYQKYQYDRSEIARRRHVKCDVNDAISDLHHNRSTTRKRK